MGTSLLGFEVANSKQTINLAWFVFADYEKSLWPDGTYVLPTSMFGCPETEAKGWSTSYVNLTLPESSQQQEWNMKNPRLLTDIIEPNILGPYYYRALQMNFCVKTPTYFEDTEGNMTSAEWPRGQYCIYSFNETCPPGKNMHLYFF